ncbi:hypothetical protein [Pedobacter sp. UBA4863]|nr:hypothetical protein [Pedobacter sp. UBA4863]
MSEKPKGDSNPSPESIVRIIEDGSRSVKNGNILPSFHIPPPPPKEKK